MRERKREREGGGRVDGERKTFLDFEHPRFRVVIRRIS